MDLDEYQEKIGGISKYQIVVILSISYISFGLGFSSQAAIFISATPNHRCAIPLVDNNSSLCGLTDDEINLLFIPYEDNNDEYSSCYKYSYNLTQCNDTCDLSCIENQTDIDNVKCENGYIYDTDVYGETTISQFDLVCDRQYLDTIAQTLFFLGFFIGSAIVGPLSDWAGRKTAILVMGLGYLVTSVCAPFLPSYEWYAVFRVLVGTFTISSFIAVFTYATEIANTKRRTEAGAWINITSGTAHTVYAGIAYFARGWRTLQLIIGLLPLPLILLYFVLPETPRWLLTNHKVEEARKVVSRYAESRNTTLTDQDWKMIVKSENEKAFRIQASSKSAERIRLWDLFRRPLMRILCFNVMFSWFTASMVFYGLALNGGNLTGDPYLNNALNAMVEVFAYICIYFAVIFGRRLTLSTGFVLAGVFCISSMLCDLYANGRWELETTSTVFAITGKFFASNAFAVIYTVTSEIFPTDARATGLSLGSMAARVGGMLSPLILQVQTYVPWFTQSLFGVLSAIAGLLCLMYPETSKTNYISTMDEAENYYRENMKILKFFKGKKKQTSSSEVYDNESYKPTDLTEL